MLDLRIPSGWFFTLLGVILLAMGIVSPDTRADLARDINVNLYCGVVMLAFGTVLLVLARIARKAR